MTSVAMTVRDLKNRLEGLPDDTPVFLSTDEEGNAINDLRVVEVSNVVIYQSGKRREIDAIHPDDEEEYKDSMTPGLILWP